MLHVGTDNLRLLNDDMYLGNRHARVRDRRYDDLIDVYVTAATKLFPHAMLHWEDFGAGNARRILEKYANQAAAAEGLAGRPLTDPIQQVHEAMWRPEYPGFDVI